MKLIKMIGLLFWAVIFNGSICSVFSQPQIEGYGYLEEVYTQTDRQLYFTGEEVFVRVNKFNKLSRTQGDVSKVAYIDLFDSDNNPQVQLMVSMDAFSGSASFRLPDSLSTGNYYLRAYTSWMRNYPSSLYSYKLISVINPFKDFLTDVDLEGSPRSTNVVSSDSLYSSDVNSEGSLSLDEDLPRVSNYDGIVITDADKKLTIDVKVDKTGYSKREKVKVDIRVFDEDGNPVESDLSVSVAKSFLVNQKASTSQYREIQTPSDPELSNRPMMKDMLEYIDYIDDQGIIDDNYNISTSKYLPEFEGHLLSGTIMNKQTREPLRNQNLLMSFVGRSALCRFSKTDSSGHFNFIVNEKGLQDLVIYPLDYSYGYTVELENPFDMNFYDVKAPLFVIDSTKLDQVNDAIIGMQIKNIYDNYTQNENNDIKKEDEAYFYGQPVDQIMLSDYIELSTFSELLKEIVPNVWTQRRGGKATMRIFNGNPTSEFTTNPLVLIDGIPISNLESLLNAPASEIERIDIYNKRYYIADIEIEGIIHVISKKGDMSIVEFDKSVFRQGFESLYVNRDFSFPRYADPQSFSARIPDYRNTLYWNPSVVTDNQGEAKVEFYTSDENCEYVIAVEGFTNNGGFGRATVSFNVTGESQERLSINNQ